jgi:LysM repeat protein
MPRTGIRYKVRAGDTLSTIARRNNSKVDWILRANQMDNPNALRVDDEIFIPQN